MQLALLHRSTENWTTQDSDGCTGIATVSVTVKDYLVLGNKGTNPPKIANVRDFRHFRGFGSLA